MNIVKQMKWLLSFGLLWFGILALPIHADEVTNDEPSNNEPVKTELAADQSTESKPLDLADQSTESKPLDLFEAIDQGVVDVKFVARSAAKGRLVMTNNTEAPVEVLVPEAFAGVPVLRQFGGGGGAFNIPPERITRVDVPLLCLDHGLRDPSSSKPYEIRPIEDVVSSPALIEIVKAYANGELPRGASQAAAWHINSEVSWNELASKLTGTVRSFNRSSYFSRQEIQAAMAIVNRAETMTDGQYIERRNWKSPAMKAAAAKENMDDEKTDGKSYEQDPDKVIDLDAEEATAESDDTKTDESGAA